MPPQHIVIDMPDVIMAFMRLQHSINISSETPSAGVISHVMPLAVMVHFILHIIIMFAMGIIGIMFMPCIIGIMGIPCIMGMPIMFMVFGIIGMPIMGIFIAAVFIVHLLIIR